MNWAPPDIPPPDDRVNDTPPVETDAERRRLSAVPAAVWIGMLGSTLLLTAAVAVIASNWGTIGMGARVAGLAAVTCGLLVAGERLRAIAPASASLIAHVGTYLTASVGVATMSLVGVTWPGCLVVGGGALIVATELQADRWRRITMHGAQVAGWVLAATGVAALLATTAGLVAIIVSVGLLVAGAQRRSVSLAALAVLSPALTALADAGIGAGTLLQAGLVGGRLGWSGPAVGLIGATVIGAVAQHRRNDPLMVIAAASPVVGIITGFAASDGSSVAWWSVPALVLIAAELCLWLLPTDRLRSQVTQLVDVIAVTIAGGAWFAPAAASFDLLDTDLAFPWAIPITITALGVSLSLLRWRSADSVLADLGVASIAASAIGVGVAFDAPAGLIAAIAVTATLGSAIGSRRLSPYAIHPTAVWAVVGISTLADGDRSLQTMLGLALLTILVGIVVATRTRLAAANGVLGWLEMGWLTALTAGGALALLDDAAPAVGLGASAIVVLTVVLTDRRFTVWGVMTLSIGALLALDAGTADGRLDPTYWVGLAICSGVLGLLWVVQRSSLNAAASASAAVFAAAALATAFHVVASDTVVMSMLAVIALTGLAYTFERRPALDAAAATAGVVLLATTSLPVEAGWVSAAWLVVGLQGVVAGVSLQNPLVRRLGTAIAGCALVSWWFTSGWNAWFLQAIEPADIRVGDLWLAGVSIAGLVAGVTLRSSLGVNSWIAYSAPLTITGFWLTSVHVQREAVWALPLLLTIAVASAGLGAWHRLAAPLLGGTALAAIGILLATGSDLTSVPTWTWLALGGGVLLGTAVVIERTGRPGAPDLRALVTRWQ